MSEDEPFQYGCYVATTNEPTMTNELTLTWVARPSDHHERAAVRFLDLCREQLPSALPVSFGTSEPLRDRIDESGEGAFTASWFTEDILNWHAEKPFSGGVVAGFAKAADIRYVKLYVDSVVLDEPEGESAMRRMFSTVADSLDCFYADISVARQAKLFRGELQPAITNHSLVKGRKWWGLPIGDIWLAYFGPEYQDLVGPHLDLSQTNAGGALYEFANAWRGSERRDDATFAGVLPDTLLVSCTGPFGHPVSRDDIHRGVPLKAAATLPAAFIHG